MCRQLGSGIGDLVVHDMDLHITMGGCDQQVGKLGDHIGVCFRQRNSFCRLIQLVQNLAGVGQQPSQDRHEE